MQTIKNEPVGFAGQELEKYIVRMTGAKPGIELCVEAEAFRGAFGASFDPALDDAWDAAFSGGKARVKASNPRSVLLGTYRLLHALGCRFLSPAEGGEIVPQKRMEELSAHVSESAENRYRIICIEGAVSGENAVNMLDWGAKNGFNGYFIQFDDGREFYRRWYCHADNPFKETQEVPESILSACVAAFAGPVSFVGIAVPHLTKLMFNSSKPAVVLPGTFLLGAVFCLVCDLIARTVFAPTELAIGTVTAIFGAPVVIAMLLKSRRKSA